MRLEREKRARVVVRTINCATAADAIGPIKRDCEIFAASKGQFSLIEIVEHCLDYVGPCHTAWSTWTAGGADIEHFAYLLGDKRILSSKWILDASFPSRKHEYCRMLAEAAGAENLRFTASHAKFVLLRNREWNLCIRSSQNLNKCLRIETFEISDDRALAEFLTQLVRDVWATAAPLDVCWEHPEEAHRSLDKIAGPIEPRKLDELILRGRDNRKTRHLVHYGRPKGKRDGD